ncbi:hypothetical protein I552_6253 [Mycobacterium xenopi 3993]|nr:hypothetical protein I552_6253 [Mycobacterium xenopi 3993]
MGRRQGAGGYNADPPLLARDGRAWIEVRGLSSPGGAQRERVVLESLRAHPASHRRA